MGRCTLRHWSWREGNTLEGLCILSSRHVGLRDGLRSSLLVPSTIMPALKKSRDRTEIEVSSSVFVENVGGPGRNR